MTTLEIQSISRAALGWLQSSSPKRVLHVFRPVCNLIDADGAVLSLVQQEVGNGPFSAVVEGADFQEVADADSPVRVEGTSLWISDLEFGFAEAEAWYPRPDWRKIRPKLPEALKGLAEVEKMVGDEGPPLSLAELVMDVPQNFRENDPVFARSREAIQGVFNGLLARDSMTMRNSSSRLAGLGVGLTPAGDDFIVGCILALWVSLPEEEACELGRILAEEAAASTNSLSAAWLWASARGEAAEHWHHLLGALALGNAEKLREAVRGILPTGHTSGADSLGGFVATLRLLGEEQG